MPGNEVSARYEKSEAFHEAGYDAFLTGQNFISVLQYLNHMDSMGMLLLVDMKPSTCIERTKKSDEQGFQIFLGKKLYVVRGM